MLRQAQLIRAHRQTVDDVGPEMRGDHVFHEDAVEAIAGDRDAVRGQHVLVAEAVATQAQNGKIRGAALDVFNQEPLPSDHPFWNIENLIITPHVAGHYNGLRESTFELFKLNLSRYLNNEPMRNEVNFGNGY